MENWTEVGSGVLTRYAVGSGLLTRYAEAARPVISSVACFHEVAGVVGRCAQYEYSLVFKASVKK